MLAMSKTNDNTDRRRAKLAKKMDQYGAQTPLQYRLFRIRAAWRRVLSAMGPRAVLALARRKRYPQIASLGVNCEVAFRFYCRWGFVDSSVFAWAASQNLATIEAALRNLRSVHEGSFSMNERTHMWMNADCGINFHGNLKWKPDSPTPPREALDEDLAELRGRLRHLTEKLVRYLRSDEETLLVHKLSDEDAAADDLGSRLDSQTPPIPTCRVRCWKKSVSLTEPTVRPTTCAIWEPSSSSRPPRHISNTPHLAESVDLPGEGKNVFSRKKRFFPSPDFLSLVKKSEVLSYSFSGCDLQCSHILKSPSMKADLFIRLDYWKYCTILCCDHTQKGFSYENCSYMRKSHGFSTLRSYTGIRHL